MSKKDKQNILRILVISSLVSLNITVWYEIFGFVIAVLVILFAIFYLIRYWK